MGLLLANWLGLAYYMVQECAPDQHVILVQDEDGKSAKYILETCGVLSSQLDYKQEQEAKRMIREFSGEFLDYWKEITEEEQT